jgi:hypothetical protein
MHSMVASCFAKCSRAISASYCACMLIQNLSLSPSAREPQCSVGAKAALAVHDLIDAEAARRSFWRSEAADRGSTVLFGTVGCATRVYGLPMGIGGRRPKSPGQAVTRTPRVYGWTEVENTRTPRVRGCRRAAATASRGRPMYAHAGGCGRRCHTAGRGSRAIGSSRPIRLSCWPALPRLVAAR